MNAHPHEQQTLLRVQELDNRLTQLARQLRQLPQDAQLAELDAADAATTRERAEAQGALDDVRTELRRIESDVELVNTRIARDSERELATSSTKDIAALEAELESLRRRLADLEDAELVVMQQVEDAEAAVTLIDGRAAERRDARAVLEAERASASAAIEAEQADVAADRRAIAATLAPELLALYEKKRERGGGIGAGLLRQKTCGACGVALNGNDLESVRKLAADALAFCPECDAILVRTEESGL